MTVPANASVPQPLPNPIAGSVLPIKRAEELLATLPGIIAARIVANDTGAVDEIHVLTTSEVLPKQTVRNIESALIAHLGMRVDHRKISVATTVDGPRAREALGGTSGGGGNGAGSDAVDAAALAGVDPSGRRLYFEDVEVRRSRSKGLACRVTLRKGDEVFIGEADGVETERTRLELAARAALQAIVAAEGDGARSLTLDGCRVIEAFDREFVFAGVSGRVARDTMLLTGSCQIKDSVETAAVLAVLDATNRWITHER